MNQQVAVFGHGPVGRATSQRLIQQGLRVRVAQRTPPADLPTGATFQACDVLDQDAVINATQGADQVVMAVGFAYEGRLWRDAWPRAMTNLVEACASTGARLVFVDNLYMYGPQNAPLREDMPLTSFGLKPAARAEATRIWMAASQAGRVRATALRAPDFYGPGVAQSQLGEMAFGALARGKAAALAASPDMPHDFAYVPDFARGVATLLAAPDDAFGQAWHLPCAPTRTMRDILAQGAAALKVRLKITALPPLLLPALGLVSPMLRELVEMRFQWDRPYHVDAGKFAARFWSDATSFEIGAPVTALSFRSPAPAGQGAELSLAR